MLPERLKEMRSKRKLTKTFMGSLLGITRQAYSKYEEGEAEPDIATITKIASFFEVSTDYLLGNTDQKEIIKQDEEDELEKLLSDPDVEMWAKEWSESTEENRKIALDLLKQLNEVEKGRKPGDRQK